jgi:4-coumarate--CoA ligase
VSETLQKNCAFVKEKKAETLMCLFCWIELEGILMDNQNINDVAVIGVDLKDEHTEAPRAYVVPAPGVKRDAAAAAEIVKWMDEKVAYYKKLRGGVRFVDEIPKIAAGKILRRVLKDKAREEEKSGKAKL